jgi:hypothetical protein
MHIYCNIHTAVPFSNLGKHTGDSLEMGKDKVDNWRVRAAIVPVYASSVSTFTTTALIMPVGHSHFLRDSAAITGKQILVHVPTNSCLHNLRTHMIYKLAPSASSACDVERCCIKCYRDLSVQRICACRSWKSCRTQKSTGNGKGIVGIVKASTRSSPSGLMSYSAE